jgi:uncharacterized protein YqeY
MSLRSRIDEEIKNAMKAKDKVRLETVRSIKKLILEKETSVRPEGQEGLSESEEMDLLIQLAKQRRDSIEHYRAAGREDLATQEAQELAIIEEYLPQAVTEEELERILDQLIQETGATSAKDMGKVMGVAMQQLKGRADGKKIQERVKAKLAP